MAAIVFLLSVLVAAASGSPLDPLIVNGTEVSIDDFPFVVSIYKDNAFHSAGNIIGENWVITEGGSLEDVRAGRLTVYKGKSVHGIGEKHTVSAIYFDTDYQRFWSSTPRIALLHIFSGFKSSANEFSAIVRISIASPSTTLATTSNTTSDTTLNTTSEPTSDTTSESTSNTTSDTTLNTTSEPTSDTTSDSTSNTTSDTTLNTTLNTTSEPTVPTTSEPTSNPKYISLPEADEETPHGKQAMVAGWGSAYEANGEAKEQQLHAKNITSIADKDCAQAGYDSSQMCAQTNNNDATICLYDQGGPVVINGTLYGIIRQPHYWSGDECFDGHKKVPFHRVAAYRKWIQKITGL